MTDPTPKTDPDLAKKVEDLKDDAARLDRPDRAIPLPDEDDDDDDGVGQVTSIVP